MFFYISKLVWLVLTPSNLIALALFLAAVALAGRWWRTGRAFAVLALAMYLGFAIFPLGAVLMRPLENRFPVPGKLGKAPDGIIVLGGAISEQLTRARGAAELTEFGTRMSETYALWRRYPQAKIVFSGGTASLLGSNITEASAAQKFFLDMGVPKDRLVFESTSRNTWENAVNSRKLLNPRKDQQWVLVTSAFHMPRSVGIFRKIGFDVIPWPAGYVTTGSFWGAMKPNREASYNLRHTDIAVKEWVGLLAYYLTGRTSALYPAPRREIR